MDQIDDQKQMEIKLYDDLLKEQHKVKQLKEALKEICDSNTMESYIKTKEAARKLLTE